MSLHVAGLSGPEASHPEEDENEMRAMRREIAEYMGELRREMVELRTSISGFGLRLDSIERRLDVLEQNKVMTNTKGTAELESTIAQLKMELNERDQEALSSDLDIGCLPEEKGENVYQIVTVLAAKLGVKIEGRDIVFAERVGGVGMSNAVSGSEITERSRRVVVRLARRNLRDEILQAARVRRNLTASDIGLVSPSALSRRIYINERLTRLNRYLFYKVREECRKRNWRYSWTKRGRIFARQSDGKQAFLIRSENDLARVFEISNVT
ncbi:hypothetical protein K1T71_013095 [Dendrolimus kikuchii]|uniref:Uncharacterized protein n=1 Tax=Dendrolimus kikuchii TaxID=765133 RepID=A0ACC1CIY3_9NEOP|nr:hypothetical protein K1T71_013095 [Dendrolimus kikuchii]